MRRAANTLLVVAVAAVVAVALRPGPSGAAPDPVTCAGYPEPRIYVENQSWWSPQLPDPTRPSLPSGGTGHIHVGACVPLYQSLAADILHLDVNVKLHDHTGTAVNLRVYLYGDLQLELNGTQPFNKGKCDTRDCEATIPVDFPLKNARYKGWHEFAVFLNVITPDGQVQRNWTRYYVNVDRPGLPDPPSPLPGVTDPLHGTGGDSWYSKVQGGTTGKYANAQIARESIPWDEETGELVPVSGVWTPTVGFEAQHNFVLVDPAFHAVPPSKGIVVFETPPDAPASGSRAVSVDTTQLADGLHRLVIGTSNQATNGTNTGVLVVPFLVDNNPCA